MTYLVAATLLIGGAVAGLSVLLAPSDMLTPRSAPPLVRAADREAAVQAPKPEPSPQPKAAAALPLPATAPADPTVNQVPAVPPPQLSNAAQAKQQTAAQPAQSVQPVRKKKIAKKPAPPQREADTTTLGYGPSEPQRRFIFPLDPGW